MLREGRDRPPVRAAGAHRLRRHHRRRRRAEHRAGRSPGRRSPSSAAAASGQSVIQGARIAGASRIFAIDPVEMKRKTAEQLGATDLIDPADGDPVEQVRAAHRRTRRRLRVRGDRPARDHPAGLRDRPGPAAPRSSSACRRFDATVTLSGDGAVLRQEGAARVHVRLGAGAARLSPLRRSWSRPAGSTSARWCRAGSPRRGQRRLPRHGGGRGHPQRHHLSSTGHTRASTACGPISTVRGRQCLIGGPGDQDRLPDGPLGARSCDPRLRTGLVEPSRTEGGGHPHRARGLRDPLLRDPPAPRRRARAPMPTTRSR